MKSSRVRITRRAYVLARSQQPLVGRAVAQSAGSLVHLCTSGLDSVAALTSSRCEPEHEANHDEDDDRRQAGHEQEVERAHSITCVMPYAPVRARNADAAIGAGVTAMKRRFKRSLCLGWSSDAPSV